MNEKNTPEIKISQEQYDALVVELVPSMLEFFKSDEGKRIYEEYLRTNGRGDRVA